MTTETADLMENAERVAAILERRRAKAERKSNDDPIVLVAFRNTCWFFATVGFVIAFGLSCLHWAKAFIPAVGVIHWFVAGMGAAFLGAVTLQLTINQRRTAAGQRWLNDKMNVEAAKIREEIRDARPVDSIVAHLQALEALVRDLTARLVTAGDDAFVDALSEQEDGQQVNGHKVTRLVRSHDHDWPRRN